MPIRSNKLRVPRNRICQINHPTMQAAETVPPVFQPVQPGVKPLHLEAQISQLNSQPSLSAIPALPPMSSFSTRPSYLVALPFSMVIHLINPGSKLITSVSQSVFNCAQSIQPFGKLAQPTPPSVEVAEEQSAQRKQKRKMAAAVP